MIIKKFKNKIILNKVILNTIILIITSLLIRMLGLINRIILTRLLGNEGISLYTISMPTIMLFLSLGSMSLSIAITKVASTKPTLSTIKKGIIISLVSSTISSIILILILHLLVNHWLKQPSSYYPILLSIPLIYLTSISSVLRGFYNGIQKMNITSIANLIEQITRITFTILIFYVSNSNNLILMVTISIIAMSFGEFCSIIYTSLQIKKRLIEHIDQTSTKEILSIAIPTTLTGLISNITFFFEPIIYTLALTILKKSSDDILSSYSEITAYALPLITMFSFIPSSISTSMFPNLTTSSPSVINHYLKKSLFYSFLPAILITVILMVYSNESMNLLYSTTIGSKYVHEYVIFFIIFYAISPLSVTLQATNQAKTLFIISSIIHVLKLGFLFILPFISNHSLIISYLLTYYILAFALGFIVYKKYHFNIPFYIIFSFIILFFLLLFFAMLLKNLGISFILSIALLTILFLFTYFFLFRQIGNHI